MHSILKALDKLKPAPEARAHCDIPCGIYDPHLAQVAAHTVVRMAQLLAEGPDSHKASRLVAIKEEHAELAKHEVRILWGDYFRPEHLEKHKDLHEIVWKVMKAGSKARQDSSLEAAEELLDTVNKFAEIFWETKGLETVRVKAPYPTEKELVVPKA